jgi:hypothetical protein
VASADVPVDVVDVLAGDNLVIRGDSEYLVVDSNVHLCKSLDKPVLFAEFEVLSDQVKLALDMALGLGVGFSLDSDLSPLTVAFKEAFDLFGIDIGVKEAQEAGKNFSFPEDLCEEDTERFKRLDYSVVKVAEEIFKETYESRLNEKRVLELRAMDSDPLNIDWDRLLDMAKDGVKIFTPKNFKARNSPRPLRNTYVNVSVAVNSTILGYKKKNFCIFIKNCDLEKSIDSLHYSDIN